MNCKMRYLMCYFVMLFHINWIPLAMLMKFRPGFGAFLSFVLAQSCSIPCLTRLLECIFLRIIDWCRFYRWRFVEFGLHSIVAFLFIFSSWYSLDYAHLRLPMRIIQTVHRSVWFDVRNIVIPLMVIKWNWK